MYVKSFNFFVHFQGSILSVTDVESQREHRAHSSASTSRSSWKQDVRSNRQQQEQQQRQQVLRQEEQYRQQLQQQFWYKQEQEKKYQQLLQQWKRQHQEKRLGSRQIKHNIGEQVQQPSQPNIFTFQQSQSQYQLHKELDLHNFTKKEAMTFFKVFLSEAIAGNSCLTVCLHHECFPPPPPHL